ncbi:MAG: hypothetical protein EZS28_048039, partial [Streblomastix strix]
ILMSHQCLQQKLSFVDPEAKVHQKQQSSRRAVLTAQSSEASQADEIQLKKFLVEAIGVDKRKFKPGNVQPRQHWLHDAETRRWRRENNLHISEPSPCSPAEGTHAYVELAKAVSTIENSLLNALYVDQTGKSAKQYILDDYLLILTASTSYKVIREAANLSEQKRNHVLNHLSNNISRETQLELEHKAKLYAGNKSFGSSSYRNNNFDKKIDNRDSDYKSRRASGYNGAFIWTVGFPRNPDRCKTSSVLEKMVEISSKSCDRT